MGDFKLTTVADGKDPFLRELSKIVARIGTKPIEAQLTVKPGHEYWWFHEFGTGQYYDGAPTTDDIEIRVAPVGNIGTIGSIPLRPIPPVSASRAGPSGRDGGPTDRYIEVKFTREGKKSKTGRGSVTQLWYPILPRYGRFLVLRRGGKKRYFKILYHPGVKGWKNPAGPHRKGLIRSSVWLAKKEIRRNLVKLSIERFNQNVPLNRKDIVTVVNAAMRTMMKRIRKNTDRASYRSVHNKKDYAGGHLENAWGSTLAT